MFSTPGFPSVFPLREERREAMDYDDCSAGTFSGIDAGDPLPPDNRAPIAVGASAAALFGVQQPRLTGFLKRRAPTQDVGDLVQECFRRVLASRAYPRILAEQPGAYLFRTARHLLAERRRTDERRSAADHISFEEPDIAGPDPHAALEARDDMRRVAEALDRLKPRTRDIFLMHRFEGLGYEEIAAAKGMSVKGVEKQIAKAMIAVRRARAARP
jgi:RNA polymerase sigma factor (sigma-70 family)